MHSLSLATHSGQLERWIGKSELERISLGMKDWYGPPIPVGGVPGRVYAHQGGDFRGRIAEGKFATALCYLESFYNRVKRANREQLYQLNSGFASLSALISAGTVSQQRQTFQFNKIGTAANAIGGCMSMWGTGGGMPPAGAAGSAAPGGRNPTNATTGAFPFTNVGGSFTQCFVVGYTTANFVNTLLLHDRLFDVTKTMSSNATEAVTGTLSRYSGTSGTPPASAGNFLYIEVYGALGAGAHNWTVCLYTNSAGTASQTLPSVTGNNAGVINSLDMPLQTWFCPLASGDVGISKLTQMQCSSATITGTINFVIGHPIAWLPIPIVNLICIADGVNTAFNLQQIQDNAALSFLEVSKPATNGTTYTGQFETVYG